MPASGARRAIDVVRRSVAGARRVRARADAIEHARRSLEATDAEPPLVRPRDIAQHLDAGVLSGSPSGCTVETGVLVSRFASIAHGVEFHAHEPDHSGCVSQFPLRARLAAGDGEADAPADVEVGPDAWIGQGAIVMAGVTIGPGAVVATRAVVADDVAPYAIVAGVPARRIGQRFGDGQIAALLRIAWWDWPLETIKARVADLCTPDIDAFIAKYSVSGNADVEN